MAKRDSGMCNTCGEKSIYAVGMCVECINAQCYYCRDFNERGNAACDDCPLSPAQQQMIAEEKAHQAKVKRPGAPIVPPTIGEMFPELATLKAAR